MGNTQGKNRLPKQIGEPPEEDGNLLQPGDRKLGQGQDRLAGHEQGLAAPLMFKNHAVLHHRLARLGMDLEGDGKVDDRVDGDQQQFERDLEIEDPLGPFAEHQPSDDEDHQNGPDTTRFSKIEMGKRSPREHRVGANNAEEPAEPGPEKQSGVSGVGGSSRMSQVTADKQRSAAEGKEEGGRYAKGNIIRLQYTNGDTYEGNINLAKQRDGYGVYICADRKRTTGYEYHGYWKEDARDGRGGKCYYYNEGFYIGDWQQDQRHGQGEHFYKYHEERYIGGWRYDMRYGNGTLMSNGRPDSGGNGGGLRHYEGRFKEDRQHGRGILKVTQNHHRYSTKQKEVKVYEQEWRVGKLVYQKKIHTVIGEEQIANLMLNTQFVNSKKHTQLLLHMYARNSRGEINFYENIKHPQLEALINLPEQQSKSRRNQQPKAESTTGWFSQHASEGTAAMSQQVKSHKQREMERSNALYRQDLLNKVIGYNQLYAEKYGRSGGGPGADHNLELLDRSKLDQSEREQIDQLNYDFENRPELCTQWKPHLLLTFLLHQHQDLSPLLTAFIDHRIDGFKFFTITSEADLARQFGIAKVGTRKNLMRLIRRQQNLLREREEAQRRQRELEEKMREEQEERHRERSQMVGKQKGQRKEVLEMEMKEENLIKMEALQDRLVGEVQGDFEDARGSWPPQRQLEGDAALERDPGADPPNSSRNQQKGAAAPAFTWAGAFQGLSQYFWNNTREKKDEEGEKERSGDNKETEEEKEGIQEEPKTATDQLASDLNDEFLDFEPCESQQPREQQAMPPESETTSVAPNEQNQQEIGDELPDEKEGEQDLKEEGQQELANDQDTLKGSSPGLILGQDQVLPIECNTLDLGVSLATPAPGNGKVVDIRPGAQSQVILPATTQTTVLHTEPIRTQIEGVEDDGREKAAAEVHRLVGVAENKPHNWMATEQSSVLQQDNSSLNFVSQAFDFKGRQTTRGDNEGSDEKEKQGEEPAPDEQTMPVEPEATSQHEDRQEAPAEQEKSDGVEQPQKYIDLHRDPKALNIQQQQLSSSNNEKLKKHIVGNIGKLHGVNIDKVRERCNRKSVWQEKSSVESSGVGQGNAALIAQTSATPRQLILPLPRLRSTSVNHSARAVPRKRQLSHAPSHRSRHLFARSTLLPHALDPNARSCTSRIIGHPQRNLLGSPAALRHHPVADRQERERLEIERRERRKRREMSKNLIDVLFQTERDKERERLRMEKEKLRASQVGLVGRASSKGSRVNRHAPSDQQAPDLSRAGSRGTHQLNNVADQASEASAAGPLNRQADALPPNASGVDTEQQIVDSMGRVRQTDGNDEDDYGNLDRDAYKYLLNTFNDNGFSFYIDISDLKLDYKTDFLGGGGYGEVFKAVWMGNTVAVKRFGRKCIQKKSITDFIKEIEIINQVRHPNIIFYMGVSFDEHSHYYMVTEYVSRGSIFDLLHNNGGAGSHSGSHRGRIILEEAKIFKIIKELASALQYLHSKQILHCDLKSQNILLTDDWTVKICDFGLARYQEKFVRDNYGQVGTPHWMAPEILRGETYTKAADVYSFGVILWELVTGEIPHKGRSHPQIVGSVGYHAEKLKLPTFQHQKRHHSRFHDHTPNGAAPPSSKHTSSVVLDTPSPSHTPHLRKIIELCTKYDASERPTFSNILCFLERIEQRSRRKHQGAVASASALSPPLIDLDDQTVNPAGLTLDFEKRLKEEAGETGEATSRSGRGRKGRFSEYYENMMMV